MNRDMAEVDRSELSKLRSSDATPWCKQVDIWRIVGNIMQEALLIRFRICKYNKRV